ncbi:MAG: hypothetical protein HQM16_03110 [Deltaproteobacteria bacterium]|nr:hypothetical protein [Deltaproteobacteria bacterium]
MKAQLNTVLATVLARNDFRVVTHVPGFGGTQVYDELTKLAPKTASICLNEEAAFSMATGAAIYGKRAATLVKTQGLTKMANALCSTLTVGNNAANLVIAFDDTAGKSSDNIFDAKGFIRGTESPYVIVGKDPQADVMRAIQLSEQLRLPVIVYVDCEKMDKFMSRNFKVDRARVHTSHDEETQPRPPRGFPSGHQSQVSNLFRMVDQTSYYAGECFKKDPVRYVACPPLSKLQREIFLAKKSKRSPVLDDGLPFVVEDIPKKLPPHLKRIYQSYAPIFEAFGEIKADFVAGDAGTATLYAFHEKRFVDICTYMGGAPGTALGAHMAGADKSWALTGDFSFLAAGILGMNEIVSREAPVKTIVFNNGIAGATGGQTIPHGVLANFIRGHSHYIHFLDQKMPRAKLVKILEAINASDSPQVGIVKIV